MNIKNPVLKRLLPAGYALAMAALLPLSAAQAAEAKTASSTFSVESAAGDAELAGDKVEHREQVLGGSVAASFPFGS